MTGPDGLFKQLVGRLVETAAGAELTDHLGYEPHDVSGRRSGNSRNGTTPKTLLTEHGEVPVAMPRDRIVDGIDDHVPPSEIARADGGATPRARQEMRTEPLTVEAPVEHEAGDEVARDPVREATRLLLGECLALDEIRHQRVVRHDHVVVGVAEDLADEVHVGR